MNRAIVIPFYNEKSRFQFTVLEWMFENFGNDCLLVFVDDGSTDNLSVNITRFCMRFPASRYLVINLPSNFGKAKALQVGMKSAIQRHPDISHIGILDADFSAHPKELTLLFDLATKSNVEIIIGSRKQTNNNYIKTSATRLILGRIFAFYVRFVLQIKVYDTQCGCKVFRNSENLREYLQQSAVSSWLFELQYMVYLLKSKKIQSSWIEVPLTNWVHERDSKVKLLHSFRIFVGCLKLLRKSYS